MAKRLLSRVQQHQAERSREDLAVWLALTVMAQASAGCALLRRHFASVNPRQVEAQ